MTYNDLLLSQVSALYSLNIWVSAFFFPYCFANNTKQSKIKDEDEL